MMQKGGYFPLGYTLAAIVVVKKQYDPIVRESTTVSSFLPSSSYYYLDGRSYFLQLFNSFLVLQQYILMFALVKFNFRLFLAKIFGDLIKEGTGKSQE